MEEPARKGRDLQITRPEEHPVIDVSYVELPENLTRRILNSSNVLGFMALCALLLAPAFAEENPIMAMVMALAFGICAHLSIKEDGKKR